jgi:hypothetical protein
MSNRREFVKTVALGGLAAPALLTQGRLAERRVAVVNQRETWARMLCRVAEPVLSTLAENRLRESMPVEAAAGRQEDRRTCTYLEALGRTLCGLAPWLELEEKPAWEREAADRLAAWARTGLDHATDAQSPDAMNFTRGGQPLVDAAFLSLALLRGRRTLWEKLDARVRHQVVDCLKHTRIIKPGNNNWLLFSAMVETFLAVAGEEWKAEPIDVAIERHESWYKGDGTYGDGPEFHWDYYNSYVIQPFLLEILESMDRITSRWAGKLKEVTRRAVRYAAVQERLIAPDGSFPAVGRSLAYRCGAFHLLAQMAFKGQLPHNSRPGQIRNALTAVITRTLGAPGTFDDKGWLTIGLCGHQPGIGETYISTGSLYLCTFAFLPLGLGVAAPFWSEPPGDWTSRRIWGGAECVCDHAL